MQKWNAAGKPRKPQIIGIGAQKAGTTWLHDMLGQHPQIWTPPFKEAHFFDHMFKEENRRWTGWHINRTVSKIMERHDKRGQDLPVELQEYLLHLTKKPMFDKKWYKFIFHPAPANTQPLDITPEYSGLPDEGVDFVAKFLPNARFIYIIRHPVDRVISQLKMNLIRQGRRPKTEADWMKEIDAPELYERGDYAQYVPRWRARFDKDRLLILPFGRIARDPLGLLRQIESFLDLPAHDYRGAQAKVFAAPKGLAVPDSVRAEIRARVEPQFNFLAQNFDAEFNALIR